LKHLANVKKYFRSRKKDLVLLDICNGEGWSKLCASLEMEEPDRSVSSCTRVDALVCDTAKDFETELN